jgi:hypothetical protein
VGGWRGEEEDGGTKQALLVCCCAEIREQALVCLQTEVSKWRAALMRMARLGRSR